MISEDLVGNPDPASRCMHNRTKNDNRCHLDRTTVLIPFRSRNEIDRKKFPNRSHGFEYAISQLKESI